MQMNMKASNQWAKRPADERYGSLEAARAAAFDAFSHSREIKEIPFSKMEVVPHDDLYLQDYAGGKYHRLSWAAARNLATNVQAPHGYLKKLPLELAAHNYNHGIKTQLEDKKANLYVMDEGYDKRTLLRDVTSMKYTRIYHHDVLDRLISLRDEFGLRTPPARSPQRDPMEVAKMGGDEIPTRIATEADVVAGMEGGVQIKVGDVIADAGIYYGQGDPELFVFLISDKQIQDGSEAGLFRGVFFEQTETMGNSYVASYFLFRGVCGNHIVWGMRDLKEVRVKHVGKARERVVESLEQRVQSFLNRSAAEEEAKIAAAKAHVLGTSDEEVIQTLYVKGIGTLKQLSTAFALATVYDSDINPRSAWGITQGLTRLSQTLVYADARTAVDRAAGKVLGLVG